MYRSARSRPARMSLCLITAAILTACGGGTGGSDPMALSTTQSADTQSDGTAVSSDVSAQIAAATAAADMEAAASAVEPARAAGVTITPGSDTGTTQPISVAPAPAAPTSPTEQIAAATGATKASPVSPAPAPAPAPTPNAPAPSAPNGPVVDAGCGADIGGWTVPVPSKADTTVALKSPQQSGSRLHYISAARGSDLTGELYFWDGSRIIDSAGKAANASGVAYGTDPMKPSAAVKPFKRWAQVGPRSNATSDIGSRGVVGGPTAAFRAGYPDWWLFSRGETFDIGQDVLSFERQFNPSATTVDSGLAVPGGRSATERQIVGAYGDVCQPRPHFVRPLNAFVASYKASYAPTLKNVAYLSLHFDGHDRAPGKKVIGIQLLGQAAASTDILFEDVWLDAANVSIGMANSAQVTFRRSLVTDNFMTDGSHVQGIYYEGTRQGSLRIQDSILLRNGFSRGDPKTMAWPPSGAQSWDIFNRNLYISGETNSMQSGMFDSVSMIGASGDQFRPGARLERNFFYQGYVGIGAHGGYADSEGPTGTILDNVLQRFVGTGTADNRGQPGWGFQIGGGANSVEVARNIVTGAQHAANSYGVELKPLFQDCNVPFRYATRSNQIHNNVFDTAKSTAAVGGFDGVLSSQTCYNWAFPGIRNNSVFDNTLINEKSRESEYLPTGLALGTTSDTAFARNRMFTDRAAAAMALGWTGPNRTLKTYMQSRGVTVTSTDGFPEYFQRATQQRRGQWRPDWTSKELVNHMRTGFAMTPVGDK